MEGNGLAVVSGGGGGWFNKRRRKDVNKKGEPTGVGRGASNVDGSGRRATRRGMRWQKRARGARLKGPTGTWGAV